MTQVSWVGEVLSGRYQIQELLGRGGMSSVYKAWDPNLKRQVAIKLIHPHLSDEEEFVRRFEEEPAAVAQLRHPNIIQVFDFNHEQDTYYMVLEYVEGESLEARARKLILDHQKASISEVVRYIIQVCEAVDYAHKRGMIHRDIKPANIMLDANDQAILMDFGIAKILSGPKHTLTGTVIGTLAYMSPEQIRGEKIDQRSDIYSIGVMLFELLNGNPPFEADSNMSLMLKQLNDQVPDLRILQPGLPEELVKVIEKALAKEASDRYQSAFEMAAALRHVLSSMRNNSAAELAGLVQMPSSTVTQVAAHQATASVATGATFPAQGFPPSGAATGAAPAADGVRRDHRVILLLGGAALLVILACLTAGAFLWVRSASGETRAAALARNSTQTAVEQTLVAFSVATATPFPALNATATSAPTATPLPPTATPVSTQAQGPGQSPVIPGKGPFALIVQATMDGDTVVVEYETIGFIENFTGRHIHFYINTSDRLNAAITAESPMIMYGGPRPFTGLTIADLPPDAAQICAVVANVDHTPIPDSGNCVPLPMSITSLPAIDNSTLPAAAPPTLTPTRRPTKDTY